MLNFHIEDNKVLVRKAGGIERILDAMTRFRSHQTVQEYACGALWNLTRNGNILNIGLSSTIADENKLKFLSEGGMTTVLHSMHYHSLNENLQKHAVRILWNLTQHSKSRSVVLGTKCVISEQTRAVVLCREVRKTVKSCLSLNNAVITSFCEKILGEFEKVIVG